MRKSLRERTLCNLLSLLGEGPDNLDGHRQRQGVTSLVHWNRHGVHLVDVQAYIRYWARARLVRFGSPHKPGAFLEERQYRDDWGERTRVLR